MPSPAPSSATIAMSFPRRTNLKLNDLEQVLPSVHSSLGEVISVMTQEPVADCLMWSICGADLLRRIGFDAQPAAGFCAWRVGPGDADVIVHAPIRSVQQAYPPAGPAAPFHAWIHVGLGHEHVLIDLTTHLLPSKAKAIDALDGQHTQVDWHPKYLCASIAGTRGANGTAASVVEVTRAIEPGLRGCYYYETIEMVESAVFSTALEGSLRQISEAAFAVYGGAVHGRKLNVVAL